MILILLLHMIKVGNHLNGSSYILAIFNALGIKSSFILRIIGKIMGIAKKNNAHVY